MALQAKPESGLSSKPLGLRLVKPIIIQHVRKQSLMQCKNPSGLRETTNGNAVERIGFLSTFAMDMVQME